jgi:hypothetical protein
MAGFEDLVGTNWFPATTQSRDNIQAMYAPQANPQSQWPTTFRYPDNSSVPFGQFHPDSVLQELRYLRELGFRNIRFMNGSFLGYLIDPREYLRNLRTIAKACKQLGMTITYTLWIAPPGRLKMRQLELAMNLWGTSDKASVRRITDHNHLAWPDPNPNFALTPPAAPLLPPPSGTHFHGYAWVEPDWELRKLHGGPAAWPVGAHRAIVSNAGSRLGLGTSATFQALVDKYLEDLDDLLWRDTGVLLSYDLYNEADGGMGSVGGGGGLDPTGTLDLIEYCHKHLVWYRGRPVDSTVGLAHWFNIVPWYDELMRRRKVPLSYVSFHLIDIELASPFSGISSWWTLPAEWDRYLREVKARVFTGIGDIPVVCSEFYSPYKTAPNGVFWCQNHLGDGLRAIRASNMGWQLWNVLESNHFVFIASDPTSLIPWDGLIVPEDPKHGVNPFVSSGGTVPFVLQLCKRRAAFYANDMRELLAHTGGRDPSTC